MKIEPQKVLEILIIELKNEIGYLITITETKNFKANIKTEKKIDCGIIFTRMET